MNQANIEKIRNEYKRLIDIRNTIIERKERLEELERDPKVFEYITLKEMIEKDRDFFDIALQSYDDLQVMKLVTGKVAIDNTNNLYMYIGTFKEKDEFIDSNRRTFKEDPNANYRKYRNLELLNYESGYEIRVPIQECPKFEEENNIIYITDSSSVNDKYYHELKSIYFKEVIENGEEKAVEKVLKNKLH